MKKGITLVLALAAFAAMAQPYNRTYDVTGNNDVLIPSFVVPSRQGGDITISIAYDAPGVPRRDYFVLTRTDCNGNVIFNTAYYSPGTPNEGMTNVEAVVETPQGNILIAGYHYDDIRRIQQPMAMEVDNVGGPRWRRIYDDNQNDIIDAEINKVSICAVANTQGHYLIAYAADSYVIPGRDVMTNVIRIDEANQGFMIMNRKYSFPKDYGNISREYPGDIEYSPATNRYMITGYRREIDQTGGDHHSMFFFPIDANLNVLAPGFRNFFYPSRPIDQDMIYDPATRNFAVTFTHDRNQFIPTINSVMGFMTVDAGINIIGVPKYYWHNPGTEHNARSISRSNTGEYIITAGIFDPNMGTHNPSMFKINNAGNPTSLFRRYNVNDDVYFGHHNTTIDCAGNEAYILVSEHKTNLRIVHPDFNGDACGVIRYDINVKDYTPPFKTYTSSRQDFTPQRPYDFIPKPFTPPFRDCFPPGNSYRPTVATAIAQLDGQSTGTALYPTILSVDNAKLTVENSSDAVVKIEMYNIAGQLILSNGQVSTGKSEMQLNAGGNLSQGIYLVKVYDASGSLTSTTKLLITK